ncbi:MAG: hypothetical protein U0491_01170 [Candidatus Saccharimonadales bacterium]
MNTQPIDNGPNKENTTADYTIYREAIDATNGMMRTGVFSKDTYDEAVTDTRTIFAEVEGQTIPAFVSNALTHEFDPQFIGEDAMLVPAAIADSGIALPSGARIQRQQLLPDALVETIFNDPRSLTYEDFVKAFAIPKDEKAVFQNGLPEYMVFSAYDTSASPEMRAVPCPDIYSRDGHLVTSDKERLLSKLPELTKLHTDVFESQAVQAGYYGGLDAETIEALINNPDFIPIAALDKDTGEPLMFALFSTNFTDLQSIDWLNPAQVERLKEQYGQGKKTTLNLPLVVTSRQEGLGLFSSACQIAAHETIYREQADVTFLMYESNVFSIQFTPRTINKTLASLGIQNISTTVEATFITEKILTTE